ncbi:glycosyltransferase family 9 protein [Bacteroidales bacterium OttesenSCG-928-I21]|nr:glycosyltransferase family 9 protein [Bacteroidales bacterium OttesenSCG-928-I21]
METYSVDLTNKSSQIKFLIIRFSSIGDIVLTTPVVRCLKQQVKGAVVHYLTKPEYAQILAQNPYIDKIHSLQEYAKTIDELKNERFDYIIDLHKSLRSLRFKNKLKILDFSFPKLNKEKILITKFKINKLPDVHIVDRYFEAVKLFDVRNDNRGLDFFVGKNNEIKIQHEFSEIGEKFVVFAIGGQHETKKLPASKIIEICSKINYPILLLGGKDDEATGNMIANQTTKVYNFCGKYNLQQSASILSQAKVVLTHDTGLMHIAAALKKNVISIWGNTIPQFGMYPYLAGKKSKLFEINDLKCRPCSKIGYGKCPKKHFKCMNLQDADKISSYVNKTMSE